MSIFVITTGLINKGLLEEYYLFDALLFGACLGFLLGLFGFVCVVFGVFLGSNCTNVGERNQKPIKETLDLGGFLASLC